MRPARNGSDAPGVEGWRVDLESGVEELVVRGRSLDELSASPDGTLIAYSSNADHATDFAATIKIAEAAAPDRPIMIIDGDPPAGHRSWQTAGSFSPDGRLLAYVSSISNADDEQSSMIRLIDLETGEMRVRRAESADVVLMARFHGLRWPP